MLSLVSRDGDARRNREAMRAVLEVRTVDGLDLWPVAEVEPFSFLPLSGELSSAEVGTVVMRIADHNNVDSDGEQAPQPANALGSFSHGLLRLEDDIVAPGGLGVIDTSTSVTFLPGCCDGLESRRDWHRFVDDGNLLGFGHDPVSPVAERFGDIVRHRLDIRARA
ncbi:hypothetical protein [Streptomyces phaeolivaceus]|uniref:hypothetical protein n=1 Tax=Streptomyces phaeolivaceus TaxID=2653200 RepID=UPI001D03F64A|nr:hypothetical protein [Streptomyces phaeolivaceus]